jgi:outer membrane protein assembly factor BamB
MVRSCRECGCGVTVAFLLLLFSVPAGTVGAGAADASPTQGASATDWPQFLGPTRDGTYHGDDLAASWGSNGPAKVWEKAVGQGFSGPVVSDGRLILFHREGDRERVAGFDAETGEEKWNFDYTCDYTDGYSPGDYGPRATPAVANGRVYSFGIAGKLHCLDVASGEKIWRVDTRKEFGARPGYFGLASSPLVEGDAVLINVGGKNKAGIVAFDKNSGDVLWKVTDDEASYSSPVAATIDGKRHAFFFTRSGLKDLDPSTGDVRFEFPWRARIQSSVNAATPVVVGDLVFVSASYQTGAALLKVTAGTHKKVWSSDESLSNHYSTSVHREGYLYGFDGRHEGRPSLRCVELKTGDVAWEKKLSGDGAIVRTGGRLLIVTSKGELVVVSASPDGFRELARATVVDGSREAVRAHPALAAGRLYVRGPGRLVCLDLR